MKRVGNLYEKIYDMDNLREAHRRARKGKSFYTEVKLVDADEERYLKELQRQLVTKTYRTSEYEIFDRFDGRKVRTIYKLPYFPDRICQWAIIQVIEPYLIKTMVDCTYSALPGRGTEKARQKVVRALKTDVEGTRWCLKLDVFHYYPNIDVDKLKQRYRRMFKDPDLLWLLDEILDSNPDAGVPIGNYISQYSGNLYLSTFDHWVKEECKIEHYFRYMDDMVFLAATKEELQKLVLKVDSYLQKELHVNIKKSWSLFRVDDRGIDFVGYVFTHDTIRLRKSIAHTVKKTSSKIKWRVNNGIELNRKLYFSFNSLQGWLRHSHSGILKLKYFDIVEDWVEDYHDRFLVTKKNDTGG